VREPPEHWNWRAGPVDPGPAVVVDIDGVLSDAVSRQHYLEAPQRNWNAFFEACGDDPVIEEMKVLLDLLDPELRIVLLTARPERVHHLTEAWLRRYEIRWDLLIMRPWGDYELARDFKELTLWELRSAGFELRLAFEDDRRNVEMFRAEGIPCLYVHSGYYD
jgi:phosphoglycolate phosphatase-like HAD superfamily hydrolase